MDTVTRKVFCSSLHDDINAAIEKEQKYEGNGWQFIGSLRPVNYGVGTTQAFMAKHINPHIYLRGAAGMINKATFSLPEVLHGSNGIQIKTEKEYHDALSKATALIQRVSATGMQFGEFTRVDYAYNVPCNPYELSSVLRAANHPMIRTDKVRYRNNGFQLIGKVFTISGYSKSHHRTTKAGVPRNRHFGPEEHHFRLEVQAKTASAVRRLYGGPDATPVRELNFNQAWKEYRDFLLKLEQQRIPASKCCLLSLVALCEQNGVRHPSGVSALDWWCKGKCPETIRKGIREMARMTLGEKLLPLQDFLPPDPPTKFVDVLGDGTERDVVIDTH